MTMREVGTCRNPDCGQTELLWEDGYCSDTCREQATGCPVPFCTCADGCGVVATVDQLPTEDWSP